MIAPWVAQPAEAWRPLSHRSGTATCGSQTGPNGLRVTLEQPVRSADYVHAPVCPAIFSTQSDGVLALVGHRVPPIFLAPGFLHLHL